MALTARATFGQMELFGQMLPCITRAFVSNPAFGKICSVRNKRGSVMQRPRAIPPVARR